MEKRVSELHPHPLNLKLYGEEKLPQDFVESVRKKGILVPLTVKRDGTIISGHRRWRAACALGLETVPVEFIDFDNELDEREAIIDFNRQREKTFSQKMAEAEELAAIEREKARERQIKLAGTRPNTKPDLQANCPEGEQGQTRDKVAQKVGFSSGRTYERAKKVWEAAKAGNEKAKELVEQLDRGKVSIHKAYNDIRREEKRQEIQRNLQTPEKLTGKYRVIYADPPWKYSNTMPDYFIEQADHYPLMTVEEICDMPVKELAEDNAVLFLWVTSPILEESFKVINAWGFKYKASFVWDKIKHNMGHYNSVRHEFLLVATRGSCQPDVKKLFDSVVSQERTRHSEKPEIFREIIDTLYPYGKRIELFARKKVEGWDSYGNQLS